MARCTAEQSSWRPRSRAPADTVSDTETHTDADTNTNYILQNSVGINAPCDRGETQSLVPMDRAAAGAAAEQKHVDGLMQAHSRC
jgi:hypothetical protein